VALQFHVKFYGNGSRYDGNIAPLDLVYIGNP
jgi:hypothetical protein